mgnify:CR=1 FL=1
MTTGSPDRDLDRDPDLGADLGAAMALADAADLVSSSFFRDESLLAVKKDDGTPVSEIDFATERAIVSAVERLCPGDAILGEEVGDLPGTTGRRWIIDGIDGTHNFTAGWSGWGTIIALEVGGTVEVGLVSAPVYGRRWWAVRGRGAWSAPNAPGRFDAARGTPLRCSSATSLAEATMFVMPSEGFLSGWRNELARHFPLPDEPRSQCIALDACMAAAGEVDAALMTLGSLWDFAATSLIVREAGGVFRDFWGTERFDTFTAVFTNPALVDEVIAELEPFRPGEPDEPVLMIRATRPAVGGGDVALDGWRAFGIREMPSMSAREHVDNAPPPVREEVDARVAALREPFRGVTTDGTVRTGLRSLAGAGVSTQPIADAALAFLGALSPEQRRRVSFPIDADEWRMWINVHMNHFRHGVLLEEMAPAVRELALGIVRATLSARGFQTARSIMRINQLIAELTGDFVAFGEWPYFVSIFGDPGADAPWGWQIDGHHLCVNAVVFDGRIVTTPAFMGSEPRRIRQGPLAGTSLFDPEEAFGLDLVRSLDTTQRERAIVYPSLHPDEIPMPLQNLFDGRMLAGAAHDNLVAPYQGIPGRDMSDAQRRLLMSLADTYVGWTADEHAVVKRAEVASHLDETWFSWYGGHGDDDPFYYRVHSPVILIEFDHHPGVVFDNEVPSRHHVHTVVRTPNGGDYGADLLAQHHERFDHSTGHHVARTVARTEDHHGLHEH